MSVPGRNCERAAEWKCGVYALCYLCYTECTLPSILAWPCHASHFEQNRPPFPNVQTPAVLSSLHVSLFFSHYLSFFRSFVLGSITSFHFIFHLSTFVHHLPLFDF